MAAAEEGTGREQWFYSGKGDPVFESMARDSGNFYEVLEELHGSVDGVMEGAKQMALGLQALSDCTAIHCARFRDARLRSDSHRFQAASRQVTLKDAPDSALAKFLRNLEYNFLDPIQEHLDHAKTLGTNHEKRERRLEELQEAKEQMDECARRGVDDSHRDFQMAHREFRVSRRHFDQADRRIFEWLYVLEAHRGDILDSSLQTLKYLQYEFFAQSANALAQVLPDRMDFRPMTDMEPEQLRALLEHDAAASAGSAATAGPASAGPLPPAAVAGFTVRLAEKLAQDGECLSPSGGLAVDVLSLSSLLSHGFDEGQARKALRLHNNSTQAALEWLLSGAADGLCHEDEGARRRRQRRLDGAQRCQDEGDCENIAIGKR